MGQKPSDDDTPTSFPIGDYIGKTQMGDKRDRWWDEDPVETKRPRLVGCCPDIEAELVKQEMNDEVSEFAIIAAKAMTAGVLTRESFLEYFGF